MSVIQLLDELYRSFSVLIANIAAMCTTVYIGVIYENNKMIIGCTLKEDQSLRLLLNLVFYHFNRCEPTYKSQCIKLLDVIAMCSQT